MKFHRYIAPSVFFALVFTVSFAAATFGEPKRAEIVSFDSVLTHALSTSPLVKEVDAVLAARLAESMETSLYLNPQLGAGVGLPASPAGDADRTQISLTLSQPFRPSDFGIRQVVAELLSKSASVEQRLSLLELSQSIYLSYAKLWILQEQRRLLTEQRERARRISEKVTAATSRGALSKGEGGLFAAEYKKLSAQLLGVDADAAREQSNLLRLSAFPVTGRRFESPDKALKISADGLMQGLQEGDLPIQSRYALLAKVASEREKLSRRDAFPAVAPQLTYQRTEDGGDFVGLGVQFELPLFNRNQADILRRQGEAAATAAKDAYSRSDLFREEVTLFLRSVEALQKQAETYETEVVPSLLGALKSYDEQFSAGTGTVLSVWQAQREISNAQLAMLELWTRFFASRSDLSILTGQQL
ncbi:MAG: TolC family protein [Armatimonadota bacterium]